MTDTATDLTGEGVVRRRHRGVVWTIILLAALIALVSSLTVWVKRQALDTESWTEASTALLEDEEIRQALSVFIVDQLYTYGDVPGRLQERLPEQLDPIAEPMAGALREPAVTSVNRFLERPQVQAAWEEVNRVAHQQLLAVLEGEPRANVSTANGEVVLDLRSFVLDVATELGIGENLDEKLPPDAGQITVLQSNQLATAQDVVKGIKALSWLLALVTFLLWGLALWLARGWRRVALRGIGASLLVIGVLLLLTRQLAGDYVVNALTTTDGDNRDAASSAWLLSTTMLSELGWAALIYGLAVITGAWLAGPSKIATRVRSHLAPSVIERPALAGTAVAATFLLIVWWGPTPALRSTTGVIVLAVLVAVGFELFRRLVLAERARSVATAAPPISAPLTPAGPRGR